MAQLNNLIVTGIARFLNRIHGDIDGDSATVNNHTVEKDVPSNAVFTDTQSDWNASSGLAQILNKPTLGTAAAKNYTTSVSSGSADLVTSGAVYTAIANLPEPMVMKGTLGTGGTITSLPTASASNEGYTYKVITAGTYASQTAKVGDLFVSYNPSGSTYSWLLIPSGDETTSDTWRNIKVNGTEKLGNAISTGAVDFVNGTGTTVSFDATGSKVSTNVTYGNAANTACQGNDSRLSDARTPTSHTHGNITNGGALQTTDVTIASGDKLVVTDSSDSNKVARTSVSFDGSTTSTALTPKGTFESFAKASDITSAINALDGGTIGTPSTSKTITALSETNGQVSATFGDIAIANTQVSGLGTASTKDVPTSGNASNTQVVMGNDTRLSDSRTPTSHTHGNITNGGALQTNDITVANGDKLVVTDSSDSNKVARTSVSFDGSTTNKALTPKGTFENFVQHSADIQPLVHKTYASTSYYATTNDYANATWYFMSIKPDNWYKPFKVKLKVHSYCPAYATHESYTWSLFTGRQNSIAYANWNDRNNSAHSYLTYYPLTTTGFNAGYGHAIGISIYNADNRGSAYYRTFEIDFYECENCTVEFLDTPVKWTDWTGTGTTNYGTMGSFNALDRGLQETGDANTVTENRIAYFSGKTGAVGVWSTGLFMEDANGTYQSICTASDGTVTSSNRTTGTKIANSHGFKVGSSIWYVNTNYNANTNISGQNVVYSAVSIFDTRYAFNTTRAAGSLTPYAPIYLVGTINVTDGLYYLDQVWWTQTPNDTTKVYVLVGGAFDSTTSNVRATLYEQNTWFKYNGTNLVDMSIGGEVNQNAFSNVKVGSTTIQADSQTDTLELVAGSNVTLTPDAINDKVTISATDTTYTSEQEAESGTAVSLVTTGEKYNWNHGIETPLMHKEYTGNNIYDTGSAVSDRIWYFMSVVPDSWDSVWSVKFKVISYCVNYPEYYTETVIDTSSIKDEYPERFAKNHMGKFAGGRKTSHTHYEYKRLAQAGFNAGYGHALGIMLFADNTITGSDYYRRIIVDVYECENCSVTLLNAPVQWADWQGAGDTYYRDHTAYPSTTVNGNGYLTTFADKIFTYNLYSSASVSQYIALLSGSDQSNVYYNACFRANVDDAYIQIAKQHTSTTSVDSGLWCGNNYPAGTAGAVRGILNLFAANGKANYLLPAENDADRLYSLPVVWENSTLATTKMAVPSSVGETISNLDGLVNLMNKGNGRFYLGTVKITADIGVGVAANTWVRVMMVSQNAPNNQTYGLGCMALFFPEVNTGHITYAFIGGHTSGNYSVGGTGTIWDSGNAHDQNVKRHVTGSGDTNYRVLMSYNANDTTDTSETRSSFLAYNPAKKRLILNHSTNAMLEAPSSQLLYLRASNEANLGLVLGVRSYSGQSMWSFSPEADGGTYLMRLGMPNYRWNQIYSTASSISTSDRNEKKDIVPLDESARDFIMALNPVSYKFINGESGRTHYGMIAQDVEEEMAELGMTALDFGGFCKDQKTVPYKRMEGECEITDDMPVEGEYRYGLRYEEFMAPAIKTIQLQQEELNELRTELDELKNELAQIKAMLNGGK